MKKLYTKPEFKSWHKRKLNSLEKKKRNVSIRKRIQNARKFPGNDAPLVPREIRIVAPRDFRFIENTEECLFIFSKLRQRENVIYEANSAYVELSLLNVELIDYSTLSVLTALSDDLRLKKVTLRGNFPKDEQVKQFIENSGFLNKMRDQDGRPFPPTKASELLFFQKGVDRLTHQDNVRISKVTRNIRKYLVLEEGYCMDIRTILLEICGNAIEWSGASRNQWVLGIMYDNDRVIITVTDVGKGILRTLHKKFGQKFEDLFFKPNKVVLEGAFEEQYGSQSRLLNRNKGLPSIKQKFTDGKIKELKVVTNNVILHFDNTEKSKTFNNNTPWFRGTFYRWVVDKDCLT